MLPQVDPSILVNQMDVITNIVSSVNVSIESLKLTLLTENVITRSALVIDNIDGGLPELINVNTLFNSEVRDINNMVPINISTAQVPKRISDEIMAIPPINMSSISVNMKIPSLYIKVNMNEPPCGKITIGLKSFITALLEQMSSMLNSLVEGALNFMKSMVSQMINGAYTMIENIKWLIKNVKKAIMNMLQMIKELPKNIVKLVKSIFNQIDKQLKEVIKTIEETQKKIEAEYHRTIKNMKKYAEFVRCLVRGDTDIAIL